MNCFHDLLGLVDIWPLGTEACLPVMYEQECWQVNGSKTIESFGQTAVIYSCLCLVCVNPVIKTD